jgi:hypothetical protein
MLPLILSIIPSIITLCVTSPILSKIMAVTYQRCAVFFPARWHPILPASEPMSESGLCLDHLRVYRGKGGRTCRIVPSVVVPEDGSSFHWQFNR